MLPRNVYLLSFCLALTMAGAPMIVLLGGIIGAELSGDPSLVTMPIAVMLVGSALFSAPAALIMRKFGRRSSFVGAALIAAACALTAAGAIHLKSFLLFCAATFTIGTTSAFVMQYRFAAIESVDADSVGKAVSMVLLGGIAAAFLGPELVKHTRDWLPYGAYTGSFVGLAGFYLLAALVLSFYRNIGPGTASPSSNGRPLWDVVRQPVFITAVAAGAISYGVMSFIMTATPVSMHIMDCHSLQDTAWVIQSHVMAMYLPSLFTGHLITRFGMFRIMIAGLFCMAACVGIALLNREIIHYWGALVLLGVGWNFLFVGGTSLLTKAYRPEERFRVQAVNDFLVFGFQALASLSAGAVIHRWGWDWVNLLSIPLLIFMALLLVKGEMRKTAAAG
ncbi:MFS transporter [Thermodesulfobacteriota bacterium]